MHLCDILINGGGILGLTLACGLKNSGLSIVIVEKKFFKNKENDIQNQEILVSSINEASRKLLDNLSIWNDVLKTSVAISYKKIEVWEQNNFRKIIFDSSKFSYPQLGHVVENIALHKILWEHVNKLPNVHLIHSTSIKYIIWNEQNVYIELTNKQKFLSKLVIAADGPNSYLRKHANIPLIFWNYQHHALVATIQTEYPHKNIARQIFYKEGILALLPLKKSNLCSIVWSSFPDMIRLNINKSKNSFNDKISQISEFTLGKCELQGNYKIYPLIAHYARNFAGHRIVLIGDSAHRIHPLAGQGLNLGFIDVSVLLSELKLMIQSHEDIGKYFFLRRYEYTRKKQAIIFLAGIQSIYLLFNSSNLLKIYFRKTCFSLVNSCSYIELNLVKYALGLQNISNIFTPEFLE